MDDEEMADLPEEAFEDWLAPLIAGLRSPVPTEVDRALTLADRDLKMMAGTLPILVAPVWRAFKDFGRPACGQGAQVAVG